MDWTGKRSGTRWHNRQEQGMGKTTDQPENSTSNRTIKVQPAGNGQGTIRVSGTFPAHIFSRKREIDDLLLSRKLSEYTSGDLESSPELAVQLTGLDGEYANAPFLNGAGFMITSLDSASGELFLVRVSDPKKDLTALWIALGVVAFVALGAVCVIVLYKKGIIRKKPKTEVSEPEDGDDETQTRL